MRPNPVAACAIILMGLALTSCGGDAAPASVATAPTPATGGVAPPPSPPATPGASQEAVSRIGDVTVRASVLPTQALSDEVARTYGLTRSPGTVMLLVGVRQGPEAQEVALPATITAVATELGGRRHEIALRELRSGDLLDYVGTLDISPPETLRFDVTVVREGGARSDMQFTREFYPQ
ncbi:DUF4426 domain-containing protein [Agrilutibacter solisilvae]|uniref:DUF4426 domain-containing protein n=1 Tax=Agrilutibacter solisilvae TaxID=2763317 RepID=A0A975AST8_9GAMM|nr:DUF4426 domain-containing protein [Lysobacter solisilvae]QSX78414.1 DUF4426 domain-containing protein [Lysobacter solisilvae]